MARNLALNAPDAQSSDALLADAFAALRRSDARAALRIYRRLLERDPTHAEALANLGALLCQGGDLIEGAQYLAMAVRQKPADPNARRNLANACACLAEDCGRSGDIDGMIRFTRQILALDRSYEGAINQLVHALHFGRAKAALADFAPEVAADRIGRKILIACMPKSGSSWLIGALEKLTGYPHLRLAFSFLQSEQEIHLPSLIEHATRISVTQQHCRATAANVQLLQAFGIAPVVLVRNIFDALMSLADFWATGAVRNTFVRGDFADLDRASQIDAAIDTMAAWYLQFYVSWAVAEAEERLPVHWLRYGDMMADKRGALASVLRFHGLEKSDAEIDAVIVGLESTRGATRFNRGVAGRGRREMSEDQIVRIHRIARHFPAVDFTRIGLPKAAG